jgi:hypothetical protein
MAHNDIKPEHKCGLDEEIELDRCNNLADHAHHTILIAIITNN